MHYFYSSSTLNKFYSYATLKLSYVHNNQISRISYVLTIDQPKKSLTPSFELSRFVASLRHKHVQLHDLKLNCELLYFTAPFVLVLNKVFCTDGGSECNWHCRQDTVRWSRGRLVGIRDMCTMNKSQSNKV